MVSTIFDTNVYGVIFEDEGGLELADRIVKDGSFTVHNFKLIRNELRGAPRILPVYDRIVANRVIKETKQIKDLAKSYFKEYKARGGVKGQKKILNDFKIVACASILGCDIVFSEDIKTMKHKIAREAYENINVKRGYRPPYFLAYKNLKRRYF